VRLRTLSAAAAPIACILASASSASAQSAADVIQDPQVLIEVDPVFGTNLRQGQGELIAHIENRHPSAIDGTLIALHIDWPSPIIEASASYHLEAGGSAVVHLPVNEATIFFEAKNAKGGLIFQKEITPGGNGSAVVADLAPVSPLLGALSRTAINPAYRPLTYYGGYGGTDPVIEVVTPRASPESGDLMLPNFIAGWQGVHLAVIGSDDLAKISGVELEALSGFVLAGGTLAVVRKHRGDLSSATLTAMVGGTVVETLPSTVELETVVPAPLQPPNIPKWKSAPVAPLGTTEVIGFTGGNLVPNAFGAAAPYGLGQVVLLGFDARSTATAEDAWVQVRMAELTRQAFERRAIVAADPGMVPNGPSYFVGGEGVYRDVRKLLDPNENARWGIAVGAILLLGHAVIAGPVVFSRAQKRKKPLLALALLPILSIVAFLAIVALGFIAKGTTSRARHLTFVDAGAGMKRGIARKFRGYYSAASTMLDVSPSTRTSSLSIGRGSSDGTVSSEGTLTVDRDGAYLSGLPIAPWQTVVVREDGIGTLGDGIAITADSDSKEVVVRNGSGHALRAVIVKLSDDEFRFARRIGVGESLDTATLPPLSQPLHEWVNGVKTVRSLGRTGVHPLNAPMLARALGADGDAAAAWEAVASCTSESTDWFPSKVPVLIAELDGGDGVKSDAGMRLDWDRTLVRVVGYGGEP